MRLVTRLSFNLSSFFLRSKSVEDKLRNKMCASSLLYPSDAPCQRTTIILESERTLIVFEQRRPSFGYKKRRERAQFWLRSINKREFDSCAEFTWYKGAQESTSKFYQSVANCIIYFFKAISYTNVSTICPKSSFFSKLTRFLHLRPL